MDIKGDVQSCYDELFDKIIYDEKVYRLRPREFEAFQWLMIGATIKETAEKMEISPETVKTYSSLIMRTLGVVNINHARLRYASAIWLQQLDDLWSLMVHDDTYPVRRGC